MTPMSHHRPHCWRMLGDGPGGIAVTPMSHPECLCHPHVPPRGVTVTPMSHCHPTAGRSAPLGSPPRASNPLGFSMEKGDFLLGGLLNPKTTTSTPQNPPRP